MTNQTPESVIAEAMVNAGAPLMHSRVEEGVASALRAANMLREPGEPDAANEAQVEAAAKAIADCHNPGMFERYKENWMVEARAALAAAARVPAPEGLAKEVLDLAVKTRNKADRWANTLGEIALGDEAYAEAELLRQASVALSSATVDAREHLHAKCDCVPDLGPAHCHLCGNERGAPVPWSECSAVAPAVIERDRFKGVEYIPDFSYDAWVLDEAVEILDEPTEAQIEAAARALDPIAWGRYDLLAYAKNPWPSRDLIVEHSLSRARAALVAAAGVTPQAECDCGAGPGSAVCKRVCATRAPVQALSTVDEAALIREAKAEALEEKGYFLKGHAEWTRSNFLPGPNSDACAKYNDEIGDELIEDAAELRARAAEYRKAVEL